MPQEKKDGRPRSTPADRDKQTRSRILRAASELFGEIGFEATSTKVIAARARVPSGSIFYHFGNKEALVGEIFSETVVDEMRRAFRDVAPSSNPRQDLTSVASALYEWLDSHVDQTHILFREITSHRPIARRLMQIRREAISQLATFIERYTESGALPDVNPAVAAQVLGSSLIFAVAVDHPKNKSSYIADLIAIMFGSKEPQKRKRTPKDTSKRN